MTKSLLTLLIASCVSLLHAQDAVAQAYVRPEKDITKIIPIYEYRQLHYLEQAGRGIAHAKAKSDANAAAWDPASPLVREKAFSLTKAQIVLINYELLQEDFPFLKGKPPAEIDAWVLDKAAYMAESQIRSTTGVNTAIPNEPAKLVTAFRPYQYGRALLFPVTNESGADAGFIDVKGAGARAPRNAEGGHSNGLMALGECIREYNYENLVNRVLVHAHKKGIGLKGVTTATPTVGSYAVLYTGFSILPGNAPAGLYLRQAHTRWNNVEWDGMDPLIAAAPERARATGGAGHMRPSTKAKFAKILALYDIWADESSHRGDQRFTQCDIQGTQDERLFDFGAYLVGRNEENDMTFAETIASYKLAQRVPFEQWGWDGPRDPGKDRPWEWAHGTASAIAGYLHGQPTGKDYRTWAEKHFNEMVVNPLSAWPN